MSSLRPSSEKKLLAISGRSMARLHSCLFASAFTKGVDHVSGGGTPDSTVLCELARHFHPVLSLSCVLKTRGPEIDSRSALTVVAHGFYWTPVLHNVNMWRQVLSNYRDV